MSRKPGVFRPLRGQREGAAEGHRRSEWHRARRRGHESTRRFCRVSRPALAKSAASPTKSPVSGAATPQRRRGPPLIGCRARPLPAGPSWRFLGRVECVLHGLNRRFLGAERDIVRSSRPPKDRPAVHTHSDHRPESLEGLDGATRLGGGHMRPSHDEESGEHVRLVGGPDRRVTKPDVKSPGMADSKGRFCAVRRQRDRGGTARGDASVVVQQLEPSSTLDHAQRKEAPVVDESPQLGKLQVPWKLWASVVPEPLDGMEARTVCVAVEDAAERLREGAGLDLDTERPGASSGTVESVRRRAVAPVQRAVGGSREPSISEGGSST